MEYKVSKIKLSHEAAQQKIRSWCAYQERSQNETRQKLLEYRLQPEEAEAIIADLIGENFLNEERFAIALAGGKFRIKHWGKNKIKMELNKHRVSEYCINKALKEIKGDEYEAVITKVIEKKAREIKITDSQKRFFTLLNYLVSRGFESDLVRERLEQLKQETNNTLIF